MFTYIIKAILSKAYFFLAWSELSNSKLHIWCKITTNKVTFHYQI